MGLLPERAHSAFAHNPASLFQNRRLNAKALRISGIGDSIHEPDFGRAAGILNVIIILVIGTLAFLSNRLFHNLTSAVEQSQSTLMNTIVQSSLRSAEDRAMARADMIANLLSVRDTFARRDREQLLAKCGPIFEIQRAKYGLDATT